MIDEFLLKLAHKVNELATISNTSISLVESCTGGLISSAITSIPGASKYFSCSLVTYSNQSKIDLLDVDPAIIKKFGAVSTEVVTFMAQKCREKSKSSISLAIVGISGPTGGTELAPLGTVCIATASPFGVESFKFKYNGSRHQIRQQSCIEALRILIQKLKNIS